MRNPDGFLLVNLASRRLVGNFRNFNSGLVDWSKGYFSYHSIDRREARFVDLGSGYFASWNADQGLHGLGYHAVEFATPLLAICRKIL